MTSKPVALENRVKKSGKLFAPSTARNKEVIRDELVKIAPQSGDVLEVGAGTGEHAVCFASALPNLNWMPSDPDETSRMSIAAWISGAPIKNIAAPIALDVSAPDWAGISDASLAMIVSLNMVHISPFSSAKGLFSGAGRYLAGGGILFLYGPFSRNGKHTAPSNEAFDASLKARNPAWGVRDLENDLMPLAKHAGLKLRDVISMPANNFVVVFEKA